MSGTVDLALACDAARAAGALLRDAFADVSSLVTETKTTATDPVSEADTAAERLILSMLPAGDAILGEEGGVRGGDSGRRWIVDPLDGTVNFLYGIPQWCVSIALEDRLGVIYDPMRDELWAAERGGEATLNGAPVRGSSATELATSLVATGFAYDASVRLRQGEIASALLPRVRDLRRAGSAALDLAWTACGRYDAFYERGVKVWDIAAGTLICEAAGLEVRELPVDDSLPVGVVVAPAALVGRLCALVS